MPTYTVAFIVADYTYNEADSNLFPDRPVRVGNSYDIKAKNGYYLIIKMPHVMPYVYIDKRTENIQCVVYFNDMPIHSRRKK